VRKGSSLGKRVGRGDEIYDIGKEIENGGEGDACRNGREGVLGYYGD